MHAHVVPATDDLAVVNDHRADGDAPFGKTLGRLVNRSLKKWIAHRLSEALEPLRANAEMNFPKWWQRSGGALVSGGSPQA